VATALSQCAQVIPVTVKVAVCSMFGPFLRADESGDGVGGLRCVDHAPRHVLLQQAECDRH